MQAGKLLAITISGAVLMSIATPVALAGPDESILARQHFMSERTKALRPLFDVMKGEAAYDAAAVKQALAAIDAAWETAAKDEPFAPGSEKGVKVETWARPEIWTDPEGFKVEMDKDMKAMAALAASSDEASFKAAMNELGAACGSCHDKFRRPKG